MKAVNHQNLSICIKKINSYNLERQTAGKKKKSRSFDLNYSINLSRTEKDEAYTGDKNKKPEMIFPEVMKIVKKKIHKILRTKNIKKLYMYTYIHIN